MDDALALKGGITISVIASADKVLILVVMDDALALLLAA